jgi:hypothetical protein
VSYRDDVQALAARCAALESELAAERRTRSLPILDEIRVASPCSADWSAMSGDDRVRHCARCDRNVYNLSEMTRADAERLVAEREGRVCVRFYRRSDGTVLTADCPVGARARRRRRGLFAAIGTTVATVAAFIGFAAYRTGRRPVAVMGALPAVERPLTR